MVINPVFHKEILVACRVLFGPQVQLSGEFLLYLQEGGVKSAYRRRAKEVHPDAVADEERVEDFRQLARAYQEVLGFLRLRDRGSEPVPKVTPRPPGTGPFPPLRPLEFGQFLIARGVIPLRALAEALVWQRGQRPAIGIIACRWGWLSQENLARILGSRQQHGRFGEKAVRLGLLTPAQVRTLLFFQRSRQKKLGAFFIEKGLLTPDELDLLLAEHRRQTFGNPRG